MCDYKASRKEHLTRHQRKHTAEYAEEAAHKSNTGATNCRACLFGAHKAHTCAKARQADTALPHIFPLPPGFEAYQGSPPIPQPLGSHAAALGAVSSSAPSMMTSSALFPMPLPQVASSPSVVHSSAPTSVPTLPPHPVARGMLSSHSHHPFSHHQS